MSACVEFVRGREGDLTFGQRREQPRDVPTPQGVLQDFICKGGATVAAPELLSDLKQFVFVK